MELIPAHLMLTAARLLTLPGSLSLDCVLCLLMISLPNSIWCSNVECKSLQYNVKNEQVISYCNIVNPPTNTAHYSSSMFLSSLKMCSLWNLTLDICHETCWLGYLFVYIWWFCLQCLGTVCWASEEHPVCKNWVMRSWCGYLSGARCRLFAYGPADATASSNSVISCLIYTVSQ